MSIDQSYQNGTISEFTYDTHNNRNLKNNSTTNLLSHYQTRSSWRWCSFVCAAVDCFKYQGNANTINLKSNCQNNTFKQVFLQTYNLSDNDFYQNQIESNINNSTFMYQL